ncbi:PREDICTED: caspase-12-like [Chrysochloris asiatica]|uniref:Caspase-12-like n=1 Tax=Chrysochloris asiatica TaxID=185453 RepID=A0A9B0WIB0_CHRAS|nr:PREDICTED: caspase-12-like [Chrysochloris asiatica]
MAAQKSPKEDPVKEVKSIAKNIIDGLFDNLMEKNVLNGEELNRLAKRVNVIVNTTENLVEDITEKTQKTGKIFMDFFLNHKKQLSLKSHSESDDDDASEKNSESSSEEEDENQDSEPEENAASAQALALPSTVPLILQEADNELKLCPPDHFQQMKRKKANQIYSVMEKEGRTRLALIICNKEFDHLTTRAGAEIDIMSMQYLLENLGYLVVVKQNLTAQEMEIELKQFAARPEHKSSDSTFLVFMSHGILDGICGKSYSSQQRDILKDDTIFQIFNNRNCQNLKDKPKVIIMQACRGEGTGFVWMADMGADSASSLQTTQHPIQSDAITKTHVEKDFIAFKASTPHNISLRCETNGSLFISRLVSYFKKYSCYCHLEKVFRKVQHSFETPAEWTQMPTIERVTLTRYFYLFPGN